jgi:hypothetical protein
LDVHVGDILAAGITKKALRKMNSTPESVTSVEMQQALRSHIGPALLGFMSPDMAKQLIRKLIKEVMVVV